MQNEAFSERDGGPRTRAVADVLRLVESVNASMEKDLEKYSFRIRDLENFRFITVVLVFLLYSAVSVIVIRYGMGNNDNPGFITDGIIPRGMIVYYFLIAAGLPILLALLARSRRMHKSAMMLKRNVDNKIEFVENLLRRVTIWEERFKGDYYQKAILRLRIGVMTQLLEEMQAMTSVRTRGMFSELLDGLRR